MRHQLLRHGLCQSRIYDSHIGSDFKVRNGVFDSLFIVCNNGKCGYLGSCSGSGGNGTELCLLSQRWNTEDLAHIFKGAVRILVLNPHCLRRINGRSSTDCHNPIRSEVQHFLGTLHYGINGRVRLNTFKKLYLHACFLQVLYHSIQKAETLHGSTTYADEGLLSPEGLQRLQRIFSVINVSW